MSRSSLDDDCSATVFHWPSVFRSQGEHLNLAVHLNQAAHSKLGVRSMRDVCRHRDGQSAR
jgi:hypothetical protein